MKNNGNSKTDGLRSDVESVCRLLDGAGVPADPKWTSLVMYLRSLKFNDALSPMQKAAVQDIFVDMLRSGDFSDEKYHEIAKAQEQIIASPYLQKLEMALNESAQLIREFSTLLEKRRGEVMDLGEFTVETVTSGEPPDMAVKNLREAFHKLVAVMDEDARNLEHIARTDELTGLANRRGFDEFSAMRAERACTSGEELSMLMLDIDLFKKVNDTYGHTVGDHVLKAIARHMAEEVADAMGDAAYCARYGGEEFAVVLSGTGAEAAENLAERIRSRVEHVAFDLKKPGGRGKPARVQVTVSIGVCQGDPAWGDSLVQKMLDAADAALYEAKRSGRNKVVVSDESGCRT